MEELKEKLHIKDTTDWYRISHAQLKQEGGNHKKGEGAKE